MHCSRSLFFMAILCAAVFAGCTSEKAVSGPPDGVDRPLSVMVSIVPQACFVRRLGGDLVTVNVLTPPNHAAETYQVTPRQMDALGRADVYLRIGMPFEDQLVNRLASTFPSLRIVDTRQGVSLLSITGHHHHHDDDDHDHTECVDGDDPHIWLDPMRVKVQARTITGTLKELLPDHAETLAGNLDDFEAELDELHQWLTETLAPVRGRVLYVFHPAFGYLADAYGIEQRAIEYEGKSPGPQRLYAIIEEIKESGARAIFEQPQFRSVELTSIAEATGVTVALLDDLAEDYFENMRVMARTIVEHLQ